MDKEFKRSIETTMVILLATIMMFATFIMGYMLTDREGRAMFDPKTDAEEETHDMDGEETQFCALFYSFIWYTFCVYKTGKKLN